MTAKRAPGIASAIAFTTGGGVDLSASPTMQSVGTLMFFSRGAVSIAAIASNAFTHASTLSSSSRRRTAASPPRAMKPSVNQRCIVSSRIFAKPSRLALVARDSSACAALRRLRVRAGGDHQRARVLRVLDGERLRDHAAHREARDRAGPNDSSVSSACTSSA